MLHSTYYSVSRVVNIAVLVSLPIVSAIFLWSIGESTADTFFLLLLGNIGK